jgi:hypothetical protein
MWEVEVVIQGSHRSGFANHWCCKHRVRKRFNVTFEDGRARRVSIVVKRKGEKDAKKDVRHFVVAEECREKTYMLDGLLGILLGLLLPNFGVPTGDSFEGLRGLGTLAGANKSWSEVICLKSCARDVGLVVTDGG